MSKYYIGVEVFNYMIFTVEDGVTKEIIQTELKDCDVTVVIFEK